MAALLRTRTSNHADHLAGDTPDGFAALSEQQRREGVGACLEKLTDPHRECLYLVFYEGLALACASCSTPATARRCVATTT